MKKIIFTILLYCTITSMNSQITTTIIDVLVNSQTTINNCNVLDFGTNQNNNLIIYFKLQRPQSLPNGGGTLRIYLKYNSNSIPQVIGVPRNILDSYWTNTNYESTMNCDISASQIQVSGSSISVEFETNGGIKTQSCEYPIIKSTPPSFSFTPTTLSLPCGDTSSRTFTITPANIPSGANVTYQWSYSGGWSTISQTSTSLTLQPSSGTSLPPTVSVTPSINGVTQTTKTCSITRSGFTSIASITGNSNLCSSSNTYTISNTGTNTITWSCSNTAIATLNIISPTSVTLTKIGSGTVNLVATLTNSCNQTTTIPKSVNVGSPILPATVFVNGATYTGYNQTLNYSLSGSSINGGTSYQWSVDGQMNDDGGLTTCAWQILSGQGTRTVTLKSGCISGMVVVRVVATGGCGSSNTKYIYVTVGSNPCPPTLRLSQNPVKEGNLVADVIYPPNCDTSARIANTINNEIKIYDFNGNVVYKSKQNSDKLIINNLEIKKGIYLLQVITEKGEIIKEKIIIE